MNRDNLHGDESDVLTSDDEIESFSDSDLNCSNGICAVQCNNEDNNTSKSNINISKISSKSERNCPFSIDNILGKSNKHNSDTASTDSNTLTNDKFISKLPSSDICK